MAKPAKANATEPVLAELQAIKRLLMVFMTQAGLSQADLAKVVDVDQGTVSRMLKGTGKKRISFRVQSMNEEED